MTAPQTRWWPRGGRTFALARWLSGVALALVAAVVLVRRTPLAELRVAAARADATWLAVAVALTLVSETVFASEKYRRILKLLGHTVSLREVVRLRLGTYAVRSLAPYKLGEALRVAYLSRVLGVPVPAAAASALLDMALHAAILAPFAAAGLQRLLRLSFGWLALGALTAFVAALAVARTLGPRGRAALRLLVANRPTPTPRDLALLAVAGLLPAAAQVLAYLATLRAFGIAIDACAAAFDIPLVALVADLPLTPFGVGTRELATVRVLAGRGPTPALLAAGLAASTVLRAVPAVLGLPSLVRLVGRLLARRPRA